jgi:hypothetical protein
MKALLKNTCPRACFAMIGLALLGASTGCQVHVAGQTLPSPWYHTDDVQYFSPGPTEFKLPREAAAAAQYKAEEAERRR